MNHGSASTYTNYKCRCDACKAAMSAYAKARREARGARVETEPRFETQLAEHGTTSTYVNWKCRCDECREAMRAYQKDLRARREFGVVRMTHGSDRAYSVYGCRCWLCVRVHNQLNGIFVEEDDADYGAEG